MKIKNWSSYQSYKDRRPPWIRLHRSLIDNYEFQCMSANARALLPMLWLLACEDEDPISGKIPYSLDKISFRLRIPIKEVKSGINEIIEAGFVESNQSCNESVTKPLQDSKSTVTPETETENRVETEHIFDIQSSFDKTWLIYPNKDGKKEAFRHYKRTVKDEDTAQDVLIALANYKKHLSIESWKKPKNGSTWFNNWQDWLDWVEPQKEVNPFDIANLPPMKSMRDML